MQIADALLTRVSSVERYQAKHFKPDMLVEVEVEDAHRAHVTLPSGAGFDARLISADPPPRT